MGCQYCKKEAQIVDIPAFIKEDKKEKKINRLIKI